ncbi:MFS transporter [Vibrio ishigakensis]|uniref:MFS transporter n=2 Tax=Vibrio ishigakensis TaxID=1481914 RepID=A0A0B8P7M7_9VIBR|nr:MFS transporter [Vibrio ishigakensis]
MKNVHNEKMPLSVWLLTLSAFAIGTAEFVIAGILTQVSESLHITEGQAGNLITAYALAIVVGGPILMLALSKVDKRKALLSLLGLFILGNLISATTHSYHLLLLSRVLSGLTQGPFYGIGAVVATQLVSEKMAGRAVGQMFAGLTLANVLGVPAGTWIGNEFGWNTTFWAVAVLGVLSAVLIAFVIKIKPQTEATPLSKQVGAFKNPALLSGLVITVLGWSGFMAFYGYISPIAENVAHMQRDNVTWLLILVGAGLVIGNHLGGKSADMNLSKSLTLWLVATIVVLIALGSFASNTTAFIVLAFIFGVVSFAKVPAMQLRVMTHGGEGQELAATANISAFNLANAIGGMIGSSVIDARAFSTQSLPYFAIIIPVIGLMFLLHNNRRMKAIATA